jgi:hypothetical protein
MTTTVQRAIKNDVIDFFLALTTMTVIALYQIFPEQAEGKVVVIASNAVDGDYFLTFEAFAVKPRFFPML